MTKSLWWPILTGETEDPEDDTVIGASIPKEGHKGITLDQMYSLPTKQVLEITGGAYSLKLEKEHSIDASKEG